MECIFSDCDLPGEHSLGIRLRRPDTTAIWAPNLNAYVCDFHASQGMRITVYLESIEEHEIETRVQSIVPQVVERTTGIRHNP